MREDVKRLVYNESKYKTAEELEVKLQELMDLERFPITEKEIKTLKGNRIKAMKRRVVVIEDQAAM